MPESNLARAEITRSIIGAFYNVYNRLGFGFVESSYATALTAELTSKGHHVAREYATRVFDEGREYLRATNLEVGLLLHFGPKPQFYRLFVPNRPVRSEENGEHPEKPNASDDPDTAVPA